uniref:Ubiquitin-like protease family profile domain-containing protein n=1 Tax=Leersia perrieri TaxID=77586 RepID=A0A0D9X8T9_9ORYZ
MMKTSQGGVSNHFMDLRFWISLGFARGRHYHKEPTNDELFMYASSWPDCGYDFSCCKNIFIPVYWMGGYFLIIVDKELKKVFILDPRPVNKKHKDYPVGSYTRKIVCISENLMRGMRRTHSGYLVYLFMRSWSNGELRLPTYKGCGDLRK